MSRGLLDELRNSLADAIAREKAYNLLALCARLELEASDEAEGCAVSAATPTHG
jgi:hypothetical protein